MKLSFPLLLATIALQDADAHTSAFRGAGRKLSTATHSHAHSSSDAHDAPIANGGDEESWVYMGDAGTMGGSMPMSMMINGEIIRVDSDESPAVYSSKSKSSKTTPHSKSGKSAKATCAKDNEYPILDLSEPYQPLIIPHQVYSKRGKTQLTLNYDLVNYKGPSYNTILRLYSEAGVPIRGVGPTLHVEQGGSMEIDLVNCLHYPVGLDGAEAHNMYKTPNTTNIHTHGPHISGNLPGDQIFVKVYPRINQDDPGDNSTHDYTYDFGNNHMPGTFWYHPHFHGSTALQNGQGAAGMIVMDEPEDYDIPDEIKHMPEIQMVFQHMDLENLRLTASTSLDGITNWGIEGEEPLNFEITNKTTDLTNFILVNMQFLPKVTMAVGKWYRWRTVMSSIQDSLAFKSQSGDCEFQLLAKDGIYLSDAPRAVDTIILSPGNRADVAVRCNKLGQEYMNTTDLDVLFNFDPGNQPAQIQEEEERPTFEMVGDFHDPKLQPTILVIDVVNKVSESSSSSDDEAHQDERKLHADYDLEPFTTPTPCYLVDLRSVNYTDIATTFENRYNCDFGDPQKCWVYGPYGVGGDFSDPIEWINDTTYINDFDTGTVNEITLEWARFHPYHQHVNSFQIQTIKNAVLSDSAKTWYKEGDWQDVLMLPSSTNGGILAAADIRFQADEYTGHMVQHCHILLHEDTGMMAQYNVTGKEGGHWEGAKDINPECIMNTKKMTPRT